MTRGGGAGGGRGSEPGGQRLPAALRSAPPPADGAAPAHPAGRGNSAIFALRKKSRASGRAEGAGGRPPAQGACPGPRSSAGGGFAPHRRAPVPRQRYAVFCLYTNRYSKQWGAYLTKKKVGVGAHFSGRRAGGLIAAPHRPPHPGRLSLPQRCAGLRRGRDEGSASLARRVAIATRSFGHPQAARLCHLETAANTKKSLFFLSEV